MENSLRNGLFLIAGVLILVSSMFASALIVNSSFVSILLLVVGLGLTGFSIFQLRSELLLLLRGQRGELMLMTVGMLILFTAIAWISSLYATRYDMTASREHSLAPQTIHMLKAVDKPVHITFFHDRGMRETVELYQQIASQNDKITVEFFDPMLNPSQAKLRGVEFPGTALMESEGRKINVNGPTETDIANGILRVTQGKQQMACFTDGHGEPDPFSLESHDHTEGEAGHAHGLETKTVAHENHGMAKARNALEAMNYLVEKIALMKSANDLSRCSVLIVTGPQLPFLPVEIKMIEKFLDDGGNALFLIDPFSKTGLEPILRKYSIVLDDGMVIDEASHFWADVSAPAVTDYNRHDMTTRLPLTFFPGVRAIFPAPVKVAGTAVRPVINSSTKSFTTPDKSRADFVNGKSRNGPLTMMVSAGFNPKTEESASLVMKQLRGESVTDANEPKPDPNRKASRIVVGGDSDFATNSYYHILGNGALFLNAVNFLAARENLIGVEPRTFDLPYVNMTNTQMKGTFIMSLILVPLLMAALGVAVWWRRR
ncbi:MAG: GldG family protein [Oxalobacteraceae bacterium]|jgi:ABC-type uncharacterized transport system involved in gliding motility auxiliary subunit|nr:GldG family protein [Oxalobacteraceae bacterium]